MQGSWGGSTPPSEASQQGYGAPPRGGRGGQGQGGRGRGGRGGRYEGGYDSGTSGSVESGYESGASGESSRGRGARGVDNRGAPAGYESGPSSGGDANVSVKEMVGWPVPFCTWPCSAASHTGWGNAKVFIICIWAATHIIHLPPLRGSRSNGWRTWASARTRPRGRTRRAKAISSRLPCTCWPSRQAYMTTRTDQ